MAILESVAGAEGAVLRALRLGCAEVRPHEVRIVQIERVRLSPNLRLHAGKFKAPFGLERLHSGARPSPSTS